MKTEKKTISNINKTIQYRHFQKLQKLTKIKNKTELYRYITIIIYVYFTIYCVIYKYVLLYIYMYIYY